MYRAIEAREAARGGWGFPFRGRVRPLLVVRDEVARPKTSDDVPSAGHSRSGPRKGNPHPPVAADSVAPRPRSFVTNDEGVGGTPAGRTHAATGPATESVPAHL